MDIVGGGKVREFSKEDELPHTPGPEEIWQESFVIVWYDMTQHIGGYFRVGHDPNRQGGSSQIISNIFSPEGVFHRGGHLPLEPRHRLKNGFVSGDDTLRYEYDGRIRWTLKDQDVEMKLEVDDFVPPIDAHRREGEQDAEKILGAHVDAACSVSGVLTVKGKRYVIKDALAVRDHGWGTRDWDSMLAHRWTVATFDRNHSFAAMSFHSSNDALIKFGWVIRDGKIIFAEKVDIRAIIGMDGATNLGGTTRLMLTTGEIHEVRFEPFYPSVATWVHDTVLGFDTLCRVTWGDKVGFGVFETTSNAQSGKRRPKIYDESYGPDGWHEAKPLLR